VVLHIKQTFAAVFVQWIVVFL